MNEHSTTESEINVPHSNSGFDPSRLFGLIGFLSLVGLAIVLGSDIGAFINVPSIIVCVGGTVTLAMFSAGTRDLAHACKHFIRIFGADSVTPILKRDIQVIHGMIAYLYASGVIGFGIGLIQMLSVMNDTSAIYGALAVALLCPLYSLIGAEGILRPIMHHLVHKSSD